MERDYLGRGLQYPVALPNGRGVLVNDIALINQSIAIILGTPKGTRFMLPEFGSRSTEILFEPNDEVLFDLLTLFISEALDEWEKRIKVLKVSCTSDDITVVMCEISYKVLASNEIESYIYPFYKKIQY